MKKAPQSSQDDYGAASSFILGVDRHVRALIATFGHVGHVGHVWAFGQR
jgi:hypothetical protein